MPPYAWIQTRDVMFMLAVGLGLAVVVALARSAGTVWFSMRRRDHDEEPRVFGPVAEGNGPVPVLVWLVFVGYFVWAVAYIFLAGHGGVSR